MDQLPTSFGRGGGARDSHRNAAAPGGRRIHRGGGRGRGGQPQYGRGQQHRGRGRGGGGGGRHRSGRGQQRQPSRNNNYGNGGVADVIEEIGVASSTTATIAIEGCCHGALDTIYDRLLNNNASTKQIDLLICCGDFQSLRTPADFHSLAVPPKYRDMGSFYQYYAGHKTAPILTLFVGGNHEASQPLAELYYGGWVAPNIYYLGAAGVVRYRGLRIGGLSGIYKSHDYGQARVEVPPYDRSTLRSVYHYRNLDVYRLESLTVAAATASLSVDVSNGSNDTGIPAGTAASLDVMVSHDWPQGIEQYGDTATLIRRKPFFKQEIADNCLGSAPAMQLLHSLRPKYWFAAHLHVKFHATVPHASNDEKDGNTLSEQRIKPIPLIPSQILKATMQSPPSAAATASKQNNESSVLPKGECGGVANEVETTTESCSLVAEKIEGDATTTQFVAPESTSISCSTVSDLTEQMTKFLSLDKCLPRRQYLSILHLPIDEKYQSATDGTDESNHLEYDPEWLAIIQKTHHLSAAKYKQRTTVPKTFPTVTEADLTHIRDHCLQGTLSIPSDSFERTVPAYVEPIPNQRSVPQHPLPRMGNPQTDRLLALLELEHLDNLTIPYSRPATAAIHNRNDSNNDDENEIELDAMSDVEVILEPKESSAQATPLDDIAPTATTPSGDGSLDPMADVKKPRLE